MSMALQSQLKMRGQVTLSIATTVGQTHDRIVRVRYDPLDWIKGSVHRQTTRTHKEPTTQQQPEE
jgi:hypothetical protein